VNGTWGVYAVIIRGSQKFKVIAGEDIGHSAGVYKRTGRIKDAGIGRQSEPSGH